MTAYVVESPPVHENSVNYFYAALGFYRLGYHVERYKLSELQTKEVSDDTPVFGGMESIQTILPRYVGLPYYPPELAPFMFRSVELREISEIKDGEFFKPREHEHKLFSPRVKDDSFQCELLLGNIPEGTKVLTTPALSFVSEFRIYVHKGKILNICFYKGDPLIQPSLESINSMVSEIGGYAAAFGLDVGVLDDGTTALVELNDFCCLGNYGLKAIDYARCIADRWTEIWEEFTD